MTIANDIIAGVMPDFELYARKGESLDDMDEYGFNPIIECAIVQQLTIAEELIARKVNINNPDVTGRTALHWAVDNNDLAMTRLLLSHGADANAYTKAGLSVLVYPILRGNNSLKHLLYQHGAKLDFAMDFILGKLIGHRYELQGDVDIVNPKNEFIELDYEGFILEFTIAILHDSLRRFTSSYSTRAAREFFPQLYPIIDALTESATILKLQQVPESSQKPAIFQKFLAEDLQIFPVASRGHALCFVRYHNWWAKIDRGENSLKEGSVNIYRLTRPEAVTASFLQQFMIDQQSRDYYHKHINQQLGLLPFTKLPISVQITGNCSWANVQAIIPVAYALQFLKKDEEFDPKSSLMVFNAWSEWDKDRALEECIHRFYLANKLRKASLAAILAGVLYQACDHRKPHHLIRAEKILSILTLPEYYYILQSYLKAFCQKKITVKGHNLLKILEHCGIEPQFAN